MRKIRTNRFADFVNPIKLPKSPCNQRSEHAFICTQRASRMAAKGLVRHNGAAYIRTIVLQNAELKYAGNVREGESRYSIITGLLHLQLIPDRTAVIHSSCFCGRERKRERGWLGNKISFAPSNHTYVLRRNCVDRRDRILEYDVSSI